MANIVVYVEVGGLLGPGLRFGIKGSVEGLGLGIWGFKFWGQVATFHPTSSRMVAHSCS